jgi:hypothetical protein
MFASIFDNQLNSRPLEHDQPVLPVGRAIGRLRSITSARNRHDCRARAAGEHIQVLSMV